MQLKAVAYDTNGNKINLNPLWNRTDDLLKFRMEKVLYNPENISHKQAVEKSESEYEKYRVIQDQKYIFLMDEFYNKYLE